MSKPNVTCIVGGMYGSCGKGKVCGYLGNDFDIAVRVGAPNAGHTLVAGKNTWKMQQIPVAALINPDILVCIGAAGLINLDILKREMGYINNIEERLFIDRNAGILEERHRKQEEHEKMAEGIGSTCEGVGAAMRDKISRKPGGFRLAKDIPELRPYTANVSAFLLNRPKKKIMIEGTQGTYLSLNHSSYPFCTSKDIIASSLLSDVGLPPQSVKEVINVIRTYPIRVAGNSGPMCGKEINWATVQKRANYPTKLIEKTTVTKKVRRVCEFDMDMVVDSCKINGATQIALMFIDYIDYRDYGKTKLKDLTKKSRKFIDEVEVATNLPITLIGTGPGYENIIDRGMSDERKLISKGSSLFDEGISQDRR